MPGSPPKRLPATDWQATVTGTPFPLRDQLLARASSERLQRQPSLALSLMSDLAPTLFALLRKSPATLADLIPRLAAVAQSFVEQQGDRRIASFAASHRMEGPVASAPTPDPVEKFPWSQRMQAERFVFDLTALLGLHCLALFRLIPETFQYYFIDDTINDTALDKTRCLVSYFLMRSSPCFLQAANGPKLSICKSSWTGVATDNFLRSSRQPVAPLLVYPPGGSEVSAPRSRGAGMDPLSLPVSSSSPPSFPSTPTTLVVASPARVMRGIIDLILAASPVVGSGALGNAAVSSCDGFLLSCPDLLVCSLLGPLQAGQSLLVRGDVVQTCLTKGDGSAFQFCGRLSETAATSPVFSSVAASSTGNESGPQYIPPLPPSSMVAEVASGSRPHNGASGAAVAADACKNVSKQAAFPLSQDHVIGLVVPTVLRQPEEQIVVSVVVKEIESIMCCLASAAAECGDREPAGVLMRHTDCRGWDPELRTVIAWIACSAMKKELHFSVPTEVGDDDDDVRMFLEETHLLSSICCHRRRSVADVFACLVRNILLPANVSRHSPRLRIRVFRVLCQCLS